MVSHPGAPLRAHQLRALNAPRPIDVQADADKTPRRVRRRDPDPLPGAGHHQRSPRSGSHPWLPVERVVESWRIDDEWWRRPISRLYFRLLLQEGSRMVVFYDLIASRWYAQHD